MSSKMIKSFQQYGTPDKKCYTLKVPIGKMASDTFLCDTCGTRMFLKIYGNSTTCRREGCNGTMHRV